jgi:type I restriction enzyme M protein
MGVGVIDEIENNDVEEEQQPDIIIDLLSGKEYKLTDKERILQRMAQVLAGEYHFPLETIERDVSIPIEMNGKRRTKTADLIVYKPDSLHSFYETIRIVVVQPPSIKITDLNRGVNLLKDLLDAIDFCEFGLWTNGRDIAYLRKITGPIESRFEEISDFPGSGETLEDMDRPDRRVARVAVAEDLREMILRCHDYLYGNQSMTAPRAFSELVKLIFAKIYDEQQLRISTSYQRLFWVGITERNTPDGQNAITWRVNKLFSQLKQEPSLEGIFRPGDEIELAPKHLAWIAAEISRYNFLDTDVDVKGMAYEAMVATTMKRERGQFFTPRKQW